MDVATPANAPTDRPTLGDRLEREVDSIGARMRLLLMRVESIDSMMGTEQSCDAVSAMRIAISKLDIVRDQLGIAGDLL